MPCGFHEAGRGNLVFSNIGLHAEDKISLCESPAAIVHQDLKFKFDKGMREVLESSDKADLQNTKTHYLWWKSMTKRPFKEMEAVLVQKFCAP